jgi:hypothetical protein
MAEVRFVLKCFAFAAIILMVSQVKTKSGSTIENQIQASLVSSQMATFVNKTADGGAQLIKDGYFYLTVKMNKSSAAKTSVVKEITAKDDSDDDYNSYMSSSNAKNLKNQSVNLQEQAVVFKQQAVKKIEELNEQIQTAVSQKKEKPILFEDELIEEIE